MRFFALLLLLFSTSILAQTKKKIILSYFKAFGDRPVNHTATVAKLVKQQLEKDVEVILCPLDGGDGLPVAFHSGRANISQLKSGKLEGPSSFDGIKACFDQHPDAQQVISLGEGSCSVEIEGLARNQMSTGYSSIYKDHNGVLMPAAESISDKGPAGIPTGDENILALCIEQNINSPDKLLGYSTNAGDYVCNNLMYNFQSFIEFNKLPISFSFIHVPQSFEHNRALCGKIFEADNAEDFSAGIAGQVSSFIKTKSHVLNEILPKDDGKSTLDQICANPWMDTVPSIEIQAGAIKQLNALKNHEILQASPVKDCIRRFKVIQKTAIKSLSDN